MRKWRRVSFIANITLRKGGIWNLAQTPRKKIENPLGFFNFFPWCFSPFPNFTSPQKDVCYEHHDLRGFWVKHQGESVVFESNTTNYPTLNFFLNSEILRHWFGLGVVLLFELNFGKPISNQILNWTQFCRNLNFGFNHFGYQDYYTEFQKQRSPDSGLFPWWLKSSGHQSDTMMTELVTFKNVKQ